MEEMMIATSNQSSPAWKLYNNPVYNHNLYYNFVPPFDLTLIMEQELEEARAQIIHLKAELGLQHRLRKKMEYVCEELAGRVSFHKAEMDRVMKEMEEERQMLRVAEVFREERLQMKLADAKIFYEEKLLRFEGMKSAGGNGFVLPVSENPHIKRGIKGSVEFRRAMYSNKSNRHLECQKAQFRVLLNQRTHLLRPNNLVFS